jgi:galactitol-specific phosphotransferase system IIB component
MNKDTKILCACRSGYIRSVETKKQLNKRGYYNVLSVGAYNTSLGTLDMLCKWADVILLAKPRHGKYIDPKYKKKVITEFYIGDDIEGKIKKELNKIRLI